MTAKLTIRLATVADAWDIANAHVHSWKAAYRGILPAALLDGLEVGDRADRWTSILCGDVRVDGVSRPSDFVAMIGNQLVGFANAGEYRDDPSPDAAELWALYVHPDHWRSGAGTALMDRSVSRFNEMGATVGYLWVLEENEIGRSFYKRCGWRFVDVPEARKSTDMGGSVRYQLDL